LEDSEKKASDGEEGSEEPEDEDIEAEKGEKKTHPGETPEVRSEESLAETDAATTMASGAGGEAGQGKHAPDSHAGASCDHTVGVE